ncbi:MULTISPECIES: hypothetical protein [unclassified Streptomyces]|uniref:hypothetical protein n=1 Tax=unclassified Streptomyces TaxID=2593676 RepID=UPI002E0EF543|nr:hypothetical protein OG573_30365 [Streptomyces sp. NBC_01205]
MRHLTRGAAAALAAAALLVLAAGCSGSPDAGGAPGKPAGSAVPVAMPAPSGAPAPAAVLAPPAKAGEVRVEQGPFTDRVQLTALALAPAGKPGVTGHLAITSDVSDVLSLDLRAAYYDADGRLLGTGTFHYQEEGADAPAGDHHDGPRAAGDGIDFTVPAEQLTGTPASAVLSLPVLVNE